MAFARGDYRGNYYPCKCDQRSEKAMEEEIMSEPILIERDKGRNDV
jgi:hypothetical protein